MQRARFHLPLFIALLAALGAPTHVSAHPGDPGDAAASRDRATRADKFFRYGNAMDAEKNWAEAEKGFLAAWQLNSTYDVTANLGHAQLQPGKYRDAAESLSFALRNWPLIGKPEPRKLAEDRLVEARAFVASLIILMKVDRATLHERVGIRRGDEEDRAHRRRGCDPLMVTSAASGTQIYDVAITAIDATKDGGSSIALLDDGAELLLTRVDLAAGAGKAGTSGAAQSKVVTPATAKGIDGVDDPACNMAGPLAGGVGGTNMCGRTSTDGGLGGQGTTVSGGGTGGDGQPGGSGGQPGNPIGGTACNGGKGGMAMTPQTKGDDGLGCATLDLTNPMSPACTL